MFKLLLATSFMAPVIFMSFSETLYSNSQIEDLNTLNPLDRKIKSMSECEDSNIYIFFHDEYIEMHSMEHLSSAMEATSDCKVQNIKVSYASNADKALDDVKIQKRRSENFRDIFENYYDPQSVSFNKNFDVTGTSISDRAVAKISFEFDDNVANASS